MRCNDCVKQHNVCDLDLDAGVGCKECKNRNIPCVTNAGQTLTPRPDRVVGTGINYRCTPCEQKGRSCSWLQNRAQRNAGCVRCARENRVCSADGQVVEDFSLQPRGGAPAPAPAPAPPNPPPLAPANVPGQAPQQAGGKGVPPQQIGGKGVAPPSPAGQAVKRAAEEDVDDADDAGDDGSGLRRSKRKKRKTARAMDADPAPRPQSSAGGAQLGPDNSSSAIIAERLRQQQASPRPFGVPPPPPAPQLGFAPPATRGQPGGNVAPAPPGQAPPQTGAYEPLQLPAPPPMDVSEIMDLDIPDVNQPAQSIESSERQPPQDIEHLIDPLLLNFPPLQAPPPGQGADGMNLDDTQDVDMLEQDPRWAAFDRFGAQDLARRLTYPLWISDEDAGRFTDSSVNVGRMLFQNMRHREGVPGIDQHPPGHPAAVDPAAVADEPGPYPGRLPLASIATEQPAQRDKFDGQCHELVAKPAPEEPGLRRCPQHAEDACVDRLHGDDAWLVCAACDLASRQAITQPHPPGLQAREVLSMRAYWCAACARGAARREPFLYSGQRVWGHAEEAGLPSAAVTESRRTGLPGEVLGGFRGDPLPWTGCACASKLDRNVLCRGHRLRHALELGAQAAAMQEWRLRLYGRRACPVCRRRVGVDAWGFEGPRGAEGQTKAWSCLVCHEVVVVHAGKPGGTGLVP